jgi:hypothetical protein
LNRCHARRLVRALELLEQARNANPIASGGDGAAMKAGANDDDQC